jgi:hypothetical protein
MNELSSLAITRRRTLGVLLGAPAFAGALEAQMDLRNEGPAPGFGGAVEWFNSAPLTNRKAWAAKYQKAGLIVVGVHTPEFSFEREAPNVRWAVSEYQLTYPVPMDNDYGVWRAFNNNYWPANYLIDAKGRIRFHYFGEGAYAESERAIQQLLGENGATGVDGSLAAISAAGMELPPSRDQLSPETYTGYGRTERFASGQLARDSKQLYSLPPASALNQWGLDGAWIVESERAVLQTAPQDPVPIP